MSQLFEVGQRVRVTHDQGEEVGTVVSRTSPVADEPLRYTVRFDDGTESSWPDRKVSRVLTPLSDPDNVNFRQVPPPGK